MRHRLTLAAALVVLAALVACSGSDDPGPIPRTACDYGAYCNEYEGWRLAVDATNASCVQGGATPLASCPTQGVLGVCTRVRDVTIRQYHYDPATLDLVRSSCLATGDSWTAP